MKELTERRLQSVKNRTSGILAAIENQTPHASLCLYCEHMNTNTLAGARVTTRPCHSCKTDVTSGSTAVDKLCESCAKETGCCRSCGANKEEVKALFDAEVDRIVEARKATTST